MTLHEPVLKYCLKLRNFTSTKLLPKLRHIKELPMTALIDQLDSLNHGTFDDQGSLSFIPHWGYIVVAILLVLSSGTVLFIYCKCKRCNKYRKQSIRYRSAIGRDNMTVLNGIRLIFINETSINSYPVRNVLLLCLPTYVQYHSCYMSVIFKICFKTQPVQNSVKPIFYF